VADAIDVIVLATAVRVRVDPMHVLSYTRLRRKNLKIELL
jgi:hypothetical protein